MEASDWMRFMEKVEIQENGCWIWTRHIGHGGYGRFQLHGKMRDCHRLILEEKLGRPVHKHLLTRHLCGVNECCSPDHLEEGTQKQNMADKLIHGTHICGEKIWNAKLTGNDIRAIRQDPRSNREIAKSYGVDRTTVSAIKRRIDWKHIV
jgi:hypothetical protein